MKERKNPFIENVAQGVAEAKYNPIEQMEKEIESLKIENQRLRNECLKLYRRITSYEY